MANSTTVKARQALIDIAVEKCGTPESLFQVAALNGKGITDELISGQSVNYSDVVVFDVADYFRKYKLSPASATTPVETMRHRGIDYMAVGFDFIVS